jgi:hypothetical protein
MKSKYVFVILFFVATVATSLCKSAPVNVALAVNGGIATADSYGTYIGISGLPSNAINGDGIVGDATTAWCGTNIPGWLQVQFNDTYRIDSIGILWNAHNQTYSVSLSENGIDWTTVIASRASATNAYYDTPPYDRHPYDDGTYHASELVHEMFPITPMDAKFIRMDITSTSAPGSHIFQAMVSEFEAYTVPEPATLLLLTLGGLVLRRRK